MLEGGIRCEGPCWKGALDRKGPCWKWELDRRGPFGRRLYIGGGSFLEGGII